MIEINLGQYTVIYVDLSVEKRKIFWMKFKILNWIPSIVDTHAVGNIELNLKNLNS